MDHDHDNLPHSIGDGYTRKAYIKGERGYHGPLRFRYRPMLGLIRQEYLFLISSANQPRGEQRIGDSAALMGLLIDIISKQCQQLTITKPSGKSVAIISDGTPCATIRQEVAELEPNLAIKIRDICLGVIPPDEEPVPVIPGRTEIPTSVDADALQRRLESAEPRLASAAEQEAEREARASGN